MAHVEVNGKYKDGVKNLSTPRLDPKLSQQKRREVLLEWQKSRRDELLEKLRHVEDSGASESEGEEIDFLQEMMAPKRNDGVPFAPSKNNQAVDETDCKPAKVHLENAAAGRGRGKLTTQMSEKMEIVQPLRARGRGKGLIQASNTGINGAAPNDPPQPGIPLRSNNNGYRRQRRPAPCGIMLSEWLVEKPDDFEDNWMGVLCPVGKRCIVVASRGKTKVYTRRNEYLGQFASALPGGSNFSGNRRRGLTILDCIWSDKAKKFYVLDLICWNSHSVNNCTTEMRHYFLFGKFAEIPELREKAQNNAVPFMPLRFFAAENLSSEMTTAYPSFPDEIDGVLFYHKDVFYIPEVTPLVLWVHLVDMSNVLLVNINPDLLSRERPRNPNTKYYLQKPNYSKKTGACGGDPNTADFQEPCDDEVPLG